MSSSPYCEKKKGGRGGGSYHWLGIDQAPVHTIHKEGTDYPIIICKNKRLKMKLRPHDCSETPIATLPITHGHY